MAGFQVLHVDDEPDMRLLVKMSLDLDAGISTRSAASGEEALDVTAQWRPDVILLDAAMPGMDGLQTLRALQANPKTAGIPVVFLTARLDTDDMDKFAAGGSAGVIAKPFDVRGLAAAIRSHARTDDPSQAAAASTMPGFSGQATTPLEPSAGAAGVSTTRALLLDGSGGGFALTIADGVHPHPAWSSDLIGGTVAPPPHASASAGLILDILPLDAPTVRNLLGMDAALPVHGDGPPVGPSGAMQPATWDVGRAAGWDMVTGSSGVLAEYPGAAHFAHGTVPAALPDWLAGLIPRGVLH